MIYRGYMIPPETGAATAFTVVQPDAGTSPVATGAADTLTFTSTDSSVLITGDSVTDTLDFTFVDPGYVVGPASSTDNALTRYDTTTGKLVQDSLILVSDIGEILLVDTPESLTSGDYPVQLFNNSVDGATAQGFVFDTANEFVTGGASVFQILNNGVSQFNLMRFTDLGDSYITMVPGHMSIGNNVTASTQKILNVDEIIQPKDGGVAPAVSFRIVTQGINSSYSPYGLDVYSEYNGTGAIISGSRGGNFEVFFNPISGLIVEPRVYALSAKANLHSAFTIAEMASLRCETLDQSGSTGNITDLCGICVESTGLLNGTATNYYGFRQKVSSAFPTKVTNYFGVKLDAGFIISGEVRQLQIDTGVVLGGLVKGIVLNGDTDGADIYFGAGQDARIIYDGTNLIINPKVVGSGALSILGDVSLLDEDIILGTTTGTKVGTATSQKLGLWGATPVIQPAAYTPSNVTTTRTFDANSTTLDEIADVLGTLIADIQSFGGVG